MGRYCGARVAAMKIAAAAIAAAAAAITAAATTTAAAISCVGINTTFLFCHVTGVVTLNLHIFDMFHQGEFDVISL